MEQVYKDIEDAQDEEVAKYSNESSPIAPIEIPQIDENELRQFTRDYSPVARRELSYKIRMTRIRKELGLINEEEKKETIKKIKNDFDERFRLQRERFDKEKEDIRDVETISRNKGVIFVHTVPLDGVDQEGNTQMNNEVVKTGLLSTEERIGAIINEQPSISCSTVDLKASAQYGFDYFRRDTMYPFGVVIDKGTVLAAHRFDAGTVSISRTSKHRKYDKNEPDSSIQPKIEVQLEHAIDGPFSTDYDNKLIAQHGHIDGMRKDSSQNYNELTVANPHIAGFYVDEDFISEKHRFNNESSPTWRSAVEKMFKKYPDVPIYIQKNNQIREYVWRGQEGLQPLLTPGKIEKKTPSRNLGSYTWPTVDHAKIDVKVKENQRAVHYEIEKIKKLILDTYARNSILVSPQIQSEFNTPKKAFEKLVQLLDQGSISGDSVYTALDEDIGNYIRKNIANRTDMRSKIAQENDASRLGGSSMYPVYGLENQILYKTLEELAAKIEQHGHSDIAARIRTIGR